MSIKKTALLAEELIVISDSIPSNYVRKEILEAAERLKDLQRIADFYRDEASRLAGKNRRKEICKNMYQKK
jgi:hypothetical protein